MGFNLAPIGQYMLSQTLPRLLLQYIQSSNRFLIVQVEDEKNTTNLKSDLKVGGVYNTETLRLRYRILKTYERSRF